jgi:hypothetical protein
MPPTARQADHKPHTVREPCEAPGNPRHRSYTPRAGTKRHEKQQQESKPNCRQLHMPEPLIPEDLKPEGFVRESRCLLPNRTGQP